ncbi:hypothetical protein [Lactobacillus corticis]|uniref:Type VII secretion protein EssA n=1 Tax=Lactobacillus corticis TaxID=2201249 RepID=A0A916VHK7_9LACO|nr:hypothetical protein [Lactobacillus corticis]GFZ26280.1 hypothetical protein LCB40_01600 [Lactobacillus corticis]
MFKKMRKLITILGIVIIGLFIANSAPIQAASQSKQALPQTLVERLEQKRHAKVDLRAESMAFQTSVLTNFTDASSNESQAILTNAMMKQPPKAQTKKMAYRPKKKAKTATIETSTKVETVNVSGHKQAHSLWNQPLPMMHGLLTLGQAILICLMIIILILALYIYHRRFDINDDDQTNSNLKHL